MVGVRDKDDVWRVPTGLRWCKTVRVLAVGAEALAIEEGKMRGWQSSPRESLPAAREGGRDQ